jgi:hypothetical protein
MRSAEGGRHAHRDVRVPPRTKKLATGYRAREGRNAPEGVQARTARGVTRRPRKPPGRLLALVGRPLRGTHPGEPAPQPATASAHNGSRSHRGDAHRSGSRRGRALGRDSTRPVRCRRHRSGAAPRPRPQASPLPRSRQAPQERRLDARRASRRLPLLRQPRAAYPEFTERVGTTLCRETEEYTTKLTASPQTAPSGGSAERDADERTDRRAP